MSMNIPRPEYPRPDFERSTWLNLNGEWDFEFDDGKVGEAQEWYGNRQLKDKIVVPFCFQSLSSGIHDTGMHEVFWYKRAFNLPDSFYEKRIFLNFGAVDYHTKLWINGEYAGEHRGGNTPFKFDVTRLLNKGGNTLTLRVEDRYDTVQPRGKQYWKEEPAACWYTATSGIWQTVWLETTGEICIDRIRMTPDIDAKCVRTEIYLDRVPEDAALDMEISYKGGFAGRISVDLKQRITKCTLDINGADDFNAIDEIHYWTPDSPNLYDIEFVLSCGGKEMDRVKSYFGMRKISVEGDMVLLNNRPFYQKLILDQGYWPDSLMTPPSDDAIRRDVELTKAMGFNGARKHQKIEDPRYYYWADRLGLVVWGEMPSAYNFNNEIVENITQEFTEFIRRDCNHPCIITWVPLNESWGVRNILRNKNQQDFGRMLYCLAKTLDGSRLVSTNDGWEQVDSDICAIHDYIARGEAFLKKYSDRDQLLKYSAVGRFPYAEGYEYKGQPFLMTEYGGIAFESSKGNWGYGESVKDEASFLERYSCITAAIRSTAYIRGYCYTQLTDVMQEVNGLLTPDRKPKANLEEILKINS